MTPKEYVDHIVDGIKELWKLMDIDYDDFIRTTDERHVKSCAEDFPQTATIRATSIRANTRAGTAPRANPSGRSCSSRTAAARTAAARWKRPARRAISSACRKYQDWLIDYIKTHPDFIQPPTRTQLKCSITSSCPACRICAFRARRSSGAFRWTSIPKHTVYVWVDALTNYITALGYGIG